MAAVMLQVIPSVFTNYSTYSLLISANTYKKDIVSKEYCIARHDDKMCFVPICRYHNILATLKSYYRNWMHSVSTTKSRTGCIHFSSAASVAKSLSRVDNCFINCRGQFILTSKTEEWTECPASRKRDAWVKGTKNICWNPSKGPNRRKLVDHCLKTELNKLKRLNLN